MVSNIAIGAIPTAPKFRLTRDQIAQVICQVRFSTVLKIRQEDAIIAFQDAIRDRYPRYTKQEGMSFVVTPEGMQQQPAAPALHRFEASGGAFVAVLAPDFVALETSSYVDIEDFADRLIALAAAVEEHFQPAEITRVGLRFINELRLQGSDARPEMREAINPALLGLAGTAELGDAVRGFQQVAELESPSGKMLIRHGLFPGGTTVDPVPGPPSAPDPTHASPFYLLDLDAYAEEQLPYHVDGIDARLRAFNDQIRSVFAWAVEQEYRVTKLGQEDIA